MTTRPANHYFYHTPRTAKEEVVWARPRDFRGQDLPHPVVLINGTFDILHASHMRLVFAARRKAREGTVIVAMDSDRLVQCKKGPGRPILSWIERANPFNYMPVDYLVEINNSKDFEELVANARPDVRLQGGDYRHQPTRFPWVPKLFVANRGIHTSEIIKRCRNLRKQE